MHRRLSLVDEHDLACAVGSHLTHDFAAYRATGTRDKHAGTLDITVNQRVVEHNGVAAEQVLDLHLAHEGGDVGRTVVLVLVKFKLLDAVNREQRDVVADEMVGKATAHQVVVSRTEDKSIDAVLHKYVCHRVGIKAVHVEPVDGLVLLSLLDAEQSHRLVASADLALEGVGQDERVERGAEHEHASAHALRCCGEPHVEVFDQQALDHHYREGDGTNHQHVPEAVERRTGKYERQHIDGQQDYRTEDHHHDGAVEVLDYAQANHAGVTLGQHRHD